MKSAALSPQGLSRWTVLTVFLLFFLPLVFAIGLYFSKNHWHLKSTAHGVLLQPVVTLQSLPLSAKIAAQLKGHWLLMRVSDAPCEAACQRSLYFLHQIQVATGKDSSRIERVWVNGAAKSSVDIRAYQPLFMIMPDPASYQRFVTQLAAADKTMTPLQPATYIVDPLGNIILRYAETANGKDILTDLKKLLGASYIG